METKNEVSGVPELISKEQLSEIANVTERWNEGLEPMLLRVADVTERWNERLQPILLEVQKAAKGWAIMHGILKSDYDEILTQYTPYFIKHGFITPKHFDDFFMWLCGCRYPDEPFGALEIKESDFTLFHQYKELKLNPSGWNDHQERERLEVMFNSLPPQPIAKQKPQLNGKLITFKNSETIEKIHTELKGYFPKKETELLKALKGEQLTEILLFPHNQNKFVEVFRRLKYNGFLLNSDTETKDWICATFQFSKKGFTEPQPFKENTVWDNLNKGRGEPKKKERICITGWLPYKSPLQLTREAENEQL